MTQEVNNFKTLILTVSDEVLESVAKVVDKEGTDSLLHAVRELIAETGDKQYMIKEDIILHGNMFKLAKDRGNTHFVDNFGTIAKA